MRFLFLVLTVAFFQNAGAQNFCNQVKKDISPDRTIFDFSSPFDPNEPPPVRVTRSYGTNPDYATDNFFMIFQVIGDLESIYKSTDSGKVEKDETKLVIEFDDKSKLSDDSLKIGHDFTNDRTQAIRYVFFNLSEPAVKELSSKKITKFSLAGYEQKVISDSAVAIQHYVQCMRDAKKD